MRLLYHITNESQYKYTQIIFSDIQYEVALHWEKKKKKKAKIKLWNLFQVKDLGKFQEKTAWNSTIIGGMKEDRL